MSSLETRVVQPMLAVATTTDAAAASAVQAAADPLLADMPAGVVIGSAGGKCPVQAEGRIDEVPFYFRARGDAWSLEVGCGVALPGTEECLPAGGWRVQMHYGRWPLAGWMSAAHVRICLMRAIEAYRADRDSGRIRPGRIFTRWDVAGVPGEPEPAAGEATGAP